MKPTLDQASAVKGGIAMWFGNREFGKSVLGIFAFLVMVGIALVLLI